MLSVIKAGLVAATVALSGCAALYGTRPQDMTGAMHRQAADESASAGHVERAAAHRDAARQLDLAARVACRNVPAAQIGPALTGLSIGAAWEVEESVGVGPPEVRGAMVRVALQGRSLESMGDLIECRAAQGAVNGMDADPFGVPGVSVRVSPDDAGWALAEIRAPDESRGKEILRRVHLRQGITAAR